MAEDQYIAELIIDEESLPPNSPEMIHERRVAVFDLLEENVFKLESAEVRGPFKLVLSRIENRLEFNLWTLDGCEINKFSISLQPFRRVVKDYFLICESYHNAIRTAMPAQIEAIDMGRRGLHNEGSRMLTDSLRTHAEIDFQTSRRLFTLLCALHHRPNRTVIR